MKKLRLWYEMNCWCNWFNGIAMELGVNLGQRFDLDNWEAWAANPVADNP
jgi:hypothetical protein